MSSQHWTPAEKRREPRRRVLKAGRIVNQDLGVTFDVIVRNMNSWGARLDVMVTTVPIPKLFRLELPLDGLQGDCEVVWRQDVRYGISFTSPMTPMAKQREQVVCMTRGNVLVDTKVR